MLELCNLALAVHIEIARDFLVANFPVEAETILFDIGKRCIALIKTLLLRRPEVNKGIRHGHIELVDNPHFAGLPPL